MTEVHPLDRGCAKIFLQNDFVIQFWIWNWIMKSYCLCFTTDGIFWRNLYPRAGLMPFTRPDTQISKSDLSAWQHFVIIMSEKCICMNERSLHSPFPPLGSLRLPFPIHRRHSTVRRGHDSSFARKRGDAPLAVDLSLWHSSANFRNGAQF